MRRQLLVSTALIALAAVLVLGVPLGVVGGRLLRQSATERLESEADAAAARLARARDAGTPITPRTLASLAAPDRRIVVRRPGGRVLSGGAAIPSPTTQATADSTVGLGRVTVVAPASERTERLGAVWLAVSLLSLAAVAAAVGLALVQARRLAGPLERLATRAASVGHAGFRRERALSGVGEVDAVEHALTEADERIATLLKRERQFSANASHQLRGPLTGLRLRLEELQALAGDEPARAEAAAALAQADRLMETIEHLETFARDREVRDAAADLAKVARQHTAQAWAPRFAEAGRELRVDARGEARAALAAEAARQVLDVLLDNALEHGAGATWVGVRDDGDWVRLVVRDAGPGVPPESRTAIFARGHSRAGGSGLGLDVARELVRRSGGELSLRDGARFEAVVPAV